LKRLFNMDDILRRKDTPVYSIENIAQFPLNPYREFVRYCITHCFDLLPYKFNMSIEDFYECDNEQRTAYTDKINSSLKNIKLIPKNTGLRPSVFFQISVDLNNSNIGNISFKTLDIVNAQSDAVSTQHSADFVFREFDGFDFTEVPREDNILSFIKDDKNCNTLDMIFAHLYGIDNFLDFVRSYKALSIKQKNIEMFTDKIIAPLVTSMQVVYMSDTFTIVTLCGANLDKYTYTYDNYMKSVQSCKDNILERYGTNYQTTDNDKNE